MAKSRKVSELINVGVKVTQGLADIGVETEAQLRKMGALEAFCRMRLIDPKWNHRMLLYALHGALIDCNC